MSVFSTGGTSTTPAAGFNRGLNWHPASCRLLWYNVPPILLRPFHIHHFSIRLEVDDKSHNKVTNAGHNNIKPAEMGSKRGERKFSSRNTTDLVFARMTLKILFPGLGLFCLI